MLTVFCWCACGVMCLHTWSGLHRPVKLYTTPLSVHVDDVTVVASLLGNGSAVVAYEVAVFASGPGSLQLQLALRERHGSTVASASLQLPGCSVPGGCVVTGQGQLLVEKPRLWWPWTMSPDDPGYLYTLEVSVSLSLTLCLSHSLTHSITHSLSLTHPLTHPLTHLLIHSLTHYAVSLHGSGDCYHVREDVRLLPTASWHQNCGGERCPVSDQWKAILLPRVRET